MQAGRRVGPVRVNGDNVGVLEPGKRLRLARPGSHYLEGHWPVSQMLLLGQVDPRERPPSQFLDEPKPDDRLTGLRKRHDGLTRRA